MKNEELKDGSDNEKTIEELIKLISESNDLDFPDMFVSINFETTLKITE